MVSPMAWDHKMEIRILQLRPLLTLGSFNVEIKYPEIGICGLSCQLCPKYQPTTKNPCLGCKSAQGRATVCPFVACALKKHEVEFCWACPDALTCKPWKAHREFSLLHDTFRCCQTLDKDIIFEKKNGLQQFLFAQTLRAKLLEKMLQTFDEGNSTAYYCTVATVFLPYEIRAALEQAETVLSVSTTLTLEERAALLHSILDEKAKEKGYALTLRA